MKYPIITYEHLMDRTREELLKCCLETDTEEQSVINNKLVAQVAEKRLLLPSCYRRFDLTYVSEFKEDV